MTRKEEIREIATKVIEELKYPHGMQMIPALEQMTNLILELTTPESSPSKKEKCSRNKTFMTPCYIEDGEMALTDDGCCVGCGLAAESFKASSPVPLESQEELLAELFEHYSNLMNSEIVKTQREIAIDTLSKFILTRRTEGKGRTEGDLDNSQKKP